MMGILLGFDDRYGISTVGIAKFCFDNRFELTERDLAFYPPPGSYIDIDSIDFSPTRSEPMVMCLDLFGQHLHRNDRIIAKPLVGIIDMFYVDNVDHYDLIVAKDRNGRQHKFRRKYCLSINSKLENICVDLKMRVR